MIPLATLNSNLRSKKDPGMCLSRWVLVKTLLTQFILPRAVYFSKLFLISYQGKKEKEGSAGPCYYVLIFSDPPSSCSWWCVVRERAEGQTLLSA